MLNEFDNDGKSSPDCDLLFGSSQVREVVIGPKELYLCMELAGFVHYVPGPVNFIHAKQFCLLTLQALTRQMLSIPAMFDLKTKPRGEHPDKHCAGLSEL